LSILLLYKKIEIISDTNCTFLFK